MESLAAPNPASRRVRRWRVPPPLTRGTELLEGADVLAELPNEAGLLLWRALRNVSLWSSAGPREQRELFASRAWERRLAEIATTELDPLLVQPLETLAGILADPAAAHREGVALACRRIAQWADARGAGATALAFTQAASLVCPHDPGLALEVGRLARRRAENSRSESWFRRAIMLGRQSADWETYALAYLGLGNLFKQRGNFPQARRAHVKGLRAARRKGHREIVGRAYHDLMTIEVESANGARAQEYAAAALRAYGAGHLRLPVLAHDVAALWLMQGQFARALAVFEAVLPHFGNPSERLQVLGSRGRAAAAAGRREAFEDSWEQVRQAAAGVPEAEGLSHALLNLAHGAATLGDWRRAEQAAARAGEIAERRGEGHVRLEVEAVLAATRACRAVESAPAAVPSGACEEEQADALAARLIAGVQSEAVGV
jgi:tetratricopeptide (TPR) repeat protein